MYRLTLEEEWLIYSIVYDVQELLRVIPYIYVIGYRRAVKQLDSHIHLFS